MSPTGEADGNPGLVTQDGCWCKKRADTGKTKLKVRQTMGDFS